MKRLWCILSLCLFAATASADTYVVFLLNQSATTADKQWIKAKWKTVFADTAEITLADLAKSKERLVADPSKVYWRWVVSKQQLTNMGADLSNITVAKFDVAKQANMQNPAHLQVAVCTPGQAWTDVLDAAGFERGWDPEPGPEL